MNAKTLFPLALLIPLAGAAVPAKAAKVDATAARAACFKQANAAAAAGGRRIQHSELGKAIGWL
jgi:hypothetical protein